MIDHHAPLMLLWYTLFSTLVCLDHVTNDHMIHCIGKKWSDKVREVHVAMKNAKAIALVVTALDEVACRLF